MLFVGIDIAKRNHEASVIAQDGSVVRKTMRFANFQAGYCEELLRTVGSFTYSALSSSSVSAPAIIRET